MNDNNTTTKGMPLNLQFFASSASESGAENNNDNNTTTETTTNTEQTGKTEVDVEKLLEDEKVKSFVTDRVTRAEKAALLNYLKDSGMTEEEAKEAFATFKATKEAKAKEAEANKSESDKIKDKEIEDAKAEADAAKAALNNMIITNTLEKQALSLGVDPARLDIALKLADLKNITIKDGVVDSDAAKKEIESVLEKLPELKKVEQNNNGFNFGGTRQESNNTSTQQKNMTYREKLALSLKSK